MHGMTASEVAEFKRIKAASRAARTADDVRAVIRMTAAWIKAARSTAARDRRRNMSRAIRGAHSQI